jgi:uncharacterized membrane protein YfcA
VSWPVTPLHALAIAAAGTAAGAINTIVGSGSLITFPTLLAVGYSPVVANVTNTVGLVPGSVSGAIGYRRELRGQRRRIFTLLPAVVLGGVTGALLLLAVPGAFDAIVPVLILLAVALVLVQPRIARRRADRGHTAEHPGPVLQVGTFLTAVYGGYFGAAQGVILLALLGITLDDDLQRLNGVKNVLAAVVNAVAAVYFIAAAHIAWAAAVILLISSSVGGQLGAVFGRRIPPNVLRMVIAVVGTAVAVKLLVD